MQRTSDAGEITSVRKAGYHRVNQRLEAVFGRCSTHKAMSFGAISPNFFLSVQKLTDVRADTWQDVWMTGDFHPVLLRSWVKPVVLCIDDDAAGLEIRKLLLEKQGYKVLTASNGPIGIDLARKTNCDAVVLDFEMPRMDGEQVALTLKTEMPSLPIILLSGFSGNIPDTLLSIVDAFALKGSGELLACIARVLENSTRKSRIQAAS